MRLRCQGAQKDKQVNLTFHKHENAVSVDGPSAADAAHLSPTNQLSADHYR